MHVLVQCKCLWKYKRQYNEDVLVITQNEEVPYLTLNRDLYIYGFLIKIILYTKTLKLKTIYPQPKYKVNLNINTKMEDGMIT